MVTTLALCVAGGYLLGKLTPRFGGRSWWTTKCQGILYVFMLVVLGARLGVQLAQSSAWGNALAYSIILTFGSVLGSFVCVYPVRGWLEPEPEEAIRAQTARLPQIGGPLRIMATAFISLGSGAVLGIVGFGLFPLEVLNPLAFALLCFLIFTIGFDAGGDDEAGSVLGSFRLRLAVVPLLIGLGSAAGAAVAGIAVGLAPREGAAIGAGCGWYSLTTLLLGDLEGPRLASWGLLANLFRETIAILLVPLIARFHRGLLLLAAPGCAAMDTTLPLLGRLGGNRIGVMAFMTGAVLSLLVPFLVPWSYRLLP